MKIQIRHGMFETNSSSVHSMVVQKPDGAEMACGMESSRLRKRSDGKVAVRYGEFDCDGIYDTQSEKLSYLVTCAYYLGYYNKEEIASSMAFRYIEEAIRQYTGCSGIVIAKRGRPYIDHQSIPYGLDDFIIDITDPDAVNRFVFNKYVRLECGRD